MHKAILINPSALTVTEATVTDDYKDILNMIGCRCFTCVRIDAYNVAYCDDEGLINGTAHGTKFKADVYPDAIAGNILILGDDGMGGSTDATLSTDEVRKMMESFVIFTANLGN
jgi:hypothetical protein